MGIPAGHAEACNTPALGEDRGALLSSGCARSFTVSFVRLLRNDNNVAGQQLQIVVRVLPLERAVVIEGNSYFSFGVFPQNVNGPFPGEQSEAPSFSQYFQNCLPAPE